MIKVGDTVVYKGRKAVEYVGKKAKVLDVGYELASLKFSDGYLYHYARVTHLKPVAKKVIKKVAKKVISKVGVTKKTKTNKVKKSK